MKKKKNGIKNKIGRWLAKACIFSFGRLVAFAAGMATPPGIIILLAAIIIGSIVTMTIIDATGPVPPAALP